MMVSRIKSYTYVHLASFLGLAGFLSLSLHLEQIGNLLIPTLVLFLVLYATYFWVDRVTGEVNILLSLVIFQVIIGWLILIRLEPQLAVRHLLWITLGCIALVMVLKFLFIFKNELILKYKLYWLFLTLLLLFIPLVLGIRVGGAKSWLDIGGLRFQPSEAAKLSFLIFVASWFKEKSSSLWKEAWPVWLGTLASLALLVLQRDLGTAMIFYLTFLIILYSISGKLKYAGQGLIFLAVGAIIAYFYFPHVQIRVQSWLNPWLEPDKGGYQILQSLFALAGGGIVGMGLGGGNPKLIPEAHTDFVFAVIGEQLGILGTTGVVLLYLFFAFFSLRRVQVIPTLGKRILAAGLTFVLVVQAFVIMGGVTKLIPLTGLPLPFMSYGGSSTISSFIMLGIIIWLEREKGFVPLVFRTRILNINKFIWLIYLLLILNLFYWQVYKAQDLFNHPLNSRWRLVEKHTARGTIFAADGSILAANTLDGSGRYYSLKEAAAHLTGYSSVKYGKAGLESYLNNMLLALSELSPGFIPENHRGFDVYTTINPELQKLAWRLHRENTGTSIVLDVKTGDILALVSSPAYDPNTLSANLKEFPKDEEALFFNRATQGLYPPGSVFKIITGAILLKLKPELAHMSTPLEPELSPEGYKIRDLVYRPSLNFRQALGYSSNTFFIKHLLDFSWPEIKKELLESFRITENFSTRELPIARAQLGEVLDKLDLAFSIIGQGEVLVTPMHMAIWAGAIANNGLLLEPNIIDKIVDEEGKIIEKRKPVVLGSVCSEKVAQVIIEGLKFSVQAGTGTKVGSDKITIGGKTGTAQNIHGDPHAWFVGIAPLDDPGIAVVTLVENGGRGGDTAAPIAKILLERALE